MEKSLTLQPIQYVNGSIFLPGSKSISNRVLLLSALSDGITKINNLLNSDDVKYMLNALKNLGVMYSLSEDKKFCVMHGKGINFLESRKSLMLYVGNAGTVIRPLLALLSLKKNEIFLTGDDRMHSRPIHDLVKALRQGGAHIVYKEKEEYPPILVKGGFLGGMITLNGNISSQFLTAIIMAAPLAPLNTKISIIGNLVSRPYIDITIKLMKIFGICVRNDSYKFFFIEGNQKYKSPKKYLVEGDASSASYFLAAAAIKGGTVTVNGVGKKSIQGDILFAHVLEKMGAIIKWKENAISCSKGILQGIDLDMNHIPDAAMTVAIVALFAIGKTIIRNIYNWRVKETDRLYAMSQELKKIGANVIEGSDNLVIIPPKKFIHGKIKTYNDHRIAMCFSLISLSNVPVTILNPECVKKTFPKYFEQFVQITNQKL